MLFNDFRNHFYETYYTGQWAIFSDQLFFIPLKSLILFKCSSTLSYPANSVIKTHFYPNMNNQTSPKFSKDQR